MYFLVYKQENKSLIHHFHLPETHTHMRDRHQVGSESEVNSLSHLNRRDLRPLLWATFDSEVFVTTGGI